MITWGMGFATCTSYRLICVTIVVLDMRVYDSKLWIQKRVLVENGGDVNLQQAN